MQVVSFYRFTEITQPEKLRDELKALCDARALLGTVLVAREGINGSITGKRDDLTQVLTWLEQHLGLAKPLEGRWNDVTAAPFRRMRVKVKKEIVTLGRPDIRPDRKTGQHVDAAAWNELLDNPDTLLIDTRNHYEYEVGTFPGALDPGTDSFRDFAGFAEGLVNEDRDRPVAMFCTGGIRCEKATALMMELGFSDVNHLQGGILKYLETVDVDDNRWQGECFVFDQRVAVDRDLAEGGYVQCHACRRPLSSEDLESPHYREGVSCPRCYSATGDERKLRLEERRKQVALAKKRGEEHIGAKLGTRE